MNQSKDKQSLVSLWQQCRDLFLTQPAPSIWFDPRPNRRVRINMWRGVTVRRSSEFRRLAQAPLQRG